jgi:tetratricopeptide (TPR) repeat protein
MSKSTELSRKEMKAPDQFQVAAGEAASWLTGHRRQTLVVVGAVVAVLIAALAILTYRERTFAGASALLSEVYRTAAGEISAVPLPGVPGPFFLSDAARQKAVAQAAEKLLAEYPGSSQAVLAALARGDARLRLGEFEAAEAAYQLYLSTASRKDSFRFSALQGLALTAEARGDTAAALAGWARLGAEVPGQADRADLERARVLVASGKADEARTLLAAFSETHKASPLSGEAAETLARLGGK